MSGYMSLEFRGPIGAENRHLGVIGIYMVFEAMNSDENI